MKTQHDTLNLDQLAEQYEVIGELAGRGDARTFMGRRRSDGVDVHIAVTRAPQGDEGNALSHLAADAQLLAATAHPNVLAVVDGQWVGTDAFALITERPDAPALDELLAKREEEFPFPRIAAILQSVNRVLEWARAQKVVHRGVSLDTLYIQPGSDRVLVAFAVGALPRAVMPGAESDAKTVGLLARAMLTRSAADPARAGRPLAELRPGLPKSVIQQTAALLELSRTSTKIPDVTGYISAIAMAEALKEGEVEVEKARHVIEEQQRLHREQLEKERRDHNEQLSEERAGHQREVEEQDRRFQSERADLELKLARERKALEKERQALAKERAAHARDCEVLTKEREAHEREVAAIREKLEWESAALATQAERYATKGELETDLVLPKFEKTPPRRPVRAPAAPPRKVERPTPVIAAAPAEPEPDEDRPAMVIGPSVWTRARERLPLWHWNRAWNVPATVAFVLGLGLTGVAIFGKRTYPAAQPPSRVTDSVAGNVTMPPETLRAVPGPAPQTPQSTTGVPPDLVSGVVGRTDTTTMPEATPITPRDPDARESTSGSETPRLVPIDPSVPVQPDPERVRVPDDVYRPAPRNAAATVQIDGTRMKVDSVRRGGVTYRPGQDGSLRPVPP